MRRDIGASRETSSVDKVFLYPLLLLRCDIGVYRGKAFRLVDMVDEGQEESPKNI